jgi:hypothetical protein
MNRREAISSVAAMLGGTIVGAELIISCTPRIENVNALFNKDHISILDEVGDTILPPTKTPGAKAAQVGNFMGLIVDECYSPKDQQAFLEGIRQIDVLSTKKYEKTFMKLNAAQRSEMLIELDKEQRAYQRNKKRNEPSHYFRMMKEFTLVGYFTSEIGATQTLRYVAVPGRYDGCMPYKKGDRAWSA